MGDISDMYDMYDDRDDDPHVHACIHCGTEGLRWSRWPVKGKLNWRLVDENHELHTCYRSPSPDDYENLDE